MSVSSPNPTQVSAIVPARNEEAVIAACITSLAAQPEITEILVVNDQSKDRTAEIVRQLMQTHPQLRLLETKELPPGWVGKNNAVWLGAREARGEWLLFTDADAVHERSSAAEALATAARENAMMVSFSPEQVMEKWYEKSLIPYVYCRLAHRFSYSDVNDPGKSTAAANGQFLLIRKEVYEAVGGHASIADEVLEDVALAKRVKEAGYRLWFGSGKGFVSVRMYRSFRSMWQGWRKNLYPLMGGTPEAAGREFVRSFVPVYAALIAGITAWGFMQSVPTAIGVFAASLVVILIIDDGELKKNQFRTRLVWYSILGRLLYAGVLLASYRSYRRGRLAWKGREYPVGTHRASK